MKRMDASLLRNRCWLALMWVWLALPVQAQLVLVTHERLPSVDELAAATAKALDMPVEVRLLSEQSQISPERYQAAVLVGPQAMAGWNQPGIPAVAVFVSRKAVQAMPGRVASAVYVEPPMARQIALTKAVLGSDRPIGVLLQTRQQLTDAGLQGLDLPSLLVTPYYISDFESLNHALQELLRRNHVLLGVYDTQLYSAANIKSILITAYRQNKALIGPSSAYLKAGALATTYSDVDDVARRLAEVLRTGLREGIWPEPGYNPYFRVGFNPQVGRSLNLLLPDAGSLARELQQREGKR